MNPTETLKAQCQLPEISFVVDLLQFVLNEYQIKWCGNNPSFSKEKKRLFTKDFGKLVLFHLLVYKNMYDSLLRVIFSEDLWSIHYIIHIIEELFELRDELFLRNITMCCAFLSHVTLHYARSDRFLIVNVITNILSYVMMSYGNRFSELNGWSSFTNFIEECNRTFKIADAA